MTTLRIRARRRLDGARRARSAPVSTSAARPTSRAVRQDAGGVERRARRRLAAPRAHAIVALPVNVLPHVAFEPPLPPRHGGGARERTPGRAYKLWFRARGLPAGSVAAGAGAGVAWIYADHDLGDGTVLALGFGYEDASFDPADPAQAAGALRALWPEAELVAYDYHDWNTDPRSRGTWPTATVGQGRTAHAERFPPHGRVYFAGADVAPHDAGWIEGALVAAAVSRRGPLGPALLLDAAHPLRLTPPSVASIDGAAIPLGTPDAPTALNTG